VSTGIFPQETFQKIKERIEEVLNWKFVPKLCHYNLNPSNTVVDKDNNVWLIDWETANGNKTPELELAEVCMWKDRKEAVSAFLDGYGISQKEFSEMMRDVQTIMLMKWLQAIQLFCPQDGDWKEDGKTSRMVEKVLAVSDFNADVLFAQNL
jgi:thiamine kinase-like enzyme